MAHYIPFGPVTGTITTLVLALLAGLEAIQGSALSLLAIVLACVVLSMTVWKLISELRDARRDAANARMTFAESTAVAARTAAESISGLAGKWDSWEKLRHQDSQTLNETLSLLRENCTMTRKTMETCPVKEMIERDKRVE